MCPNYHALADQLRRYLDVEWALRWPTAHVRKSVAQAGPPTSEELPLSFRSGLRSLGLPGSQGEVAGSRTRAQGFRGHVVVGLPRPYPVGARDSCGLNVPHSRFSATFAAEFSFALPGEIGRVSAFHSHNAWRARGACWER